MLLCAAWGAAANASAWEPPASLRETGLYSDWTRRAVADDNLPFSPQYPLWTDGAAKSRYIHLPAGTFIDARDPDAWVFPVGTKLWKEFRFGARPVETRYLERTAQGWQYAAYQWTDDSREAPLAPERGSRSVEIGGSGVRHAIPARFDCRICHEGRVVPVLGFTALQLSPDRDPNALHAEPVRPGDVDLARLVQRGLLRHLPKAVLAAPPRLAARSASERAALGYLYGNCAMCHNAAGPLASLGLSFDYTLARGWDSAAVRTTVGRTSGFRVPGTAPGASLRVEPGDPDHSAVVIRLASRNAVQQMPPLGTQLVDEEAVRLVRRWIADDLGTRRASLSPRKENDR